MRPLRIGLYLLAAVAVVAVAYALALRPVHHSGAQGSPASWNRFLRAYLYESLDRQSEKSPRGSSACDYPPTVDGRRAESADHETMLRYARCLQGLGELTPADIAALERDRAFAVTNGDWLPFALGGVTGVARGRAGLTVVTGARRLDTPLFVLVTTAGLAIVAGLAIRDVRRRRRWAR